MFRDIWKESRNLMMNWAKKWVVQFIFKKVLGGVVGGIKGFLLNFVIKRLWNKFIVPTSYLLFRKVKTFITRPFLKKKAKDLKDAKTETDFDSATDNMP